MADPTTILTARFEAALGSAFGQEHADTDPVIRRSANPRFGDYQANVAMALGKSLGRPPREVAEAIVAVLDVAGVCSEVEVAGPGFINLTLSPGFLAASVDGMAADGRLGIAQVETPKRVVIDYSAPNVAKEMHVGHLRSTIIGDALARLLGFLGHDVIRQNHFGDWGTQFGMLIEHLLDLGAETAAAELSIGELDRFYKQAKAKFDADPAFADRARGRVVLFQSGDEDSLRLWRLLVEESKRYFDTVYARLGVLLGDDDIASESFYNPWLAEVTEELEARGLARMDDGALCVFPPGFTGREDKPLPMIIRKRDGGYNYEATDLAAMRYRVTELRAEQILYVVAVEQTLRLGMLRKAGEMIGWLGDGVTAEHVAFGMLLGSDGKRFRTRSGESPKLVDLLDEAVEHAAGLVREKSAGLPEAEQAEVARAVGIGAVKYADLSNDRVKDYVFDFDRMLAMDGNTGPYLQYAVARIRSIFRRVAEEGLDATAGAVVIAEDAERALALQLLAFDAAVLATAEHLQPHRLCTYLFELASAFTTFYEHCPVLRAPDEATRASRLAMCDVTARSLALGLDLLGIESPERM